MIVKKVIGKITGKSRKFFPVVNEKGIAEKPYKFFPLTDRDCKYWFISAAIVKMPAYLKGENKNGNNSR